MIIREYPKSPVVAIGGVILDGSKVVLVRRGQEPLLGQWSIPGGAVEVGETLAEALRREILEETGLAVRAENVLEVLDRIIRDRNGKVHYHYVLVDYLCFPEAGDLRPATDASEARWADRKELARFELHPQTLRVIEKAFAAAEAPKPRAK